MSNLEFNHYGKHNVRLLRVNRRGPWHEVAEWTVDGLLEGNLAGSYLSDNNSSVVPTDTVRNTVLALAHDLEDATRDGLALALASHFVENYSHLTAADIEVREELWRRMTVGGEPHPHSFVRDSNGKPFSVVRVERGQPAKRSGGIRDFVIMKTTGSGFAGFPKCEFTSLPETDDRILATSMNVCWDYADGAADHGPDVIAVMLKVFMEIFSPSAQRTLYQMGEAALESFPGLLRIKLTMPNLHYLNIDLTKIGRPAGQKKVVLPTSDPYGYIEAVVAR